MKYIIQEMKRIVKQAGLLKNNKRLRSLFNPQVFELAIEASQITGDITWVNLARARCGLTNSVTLETIARACHENHNLVNVSFGDSPRSPWDQVPAEKMYQKHARYNNIRRLIMNIATPPYVLHEEWVKQARQYEDSHPDFKAFGELPEKQRKKTEIFHAMALSLIPLMDIEERQKIALSCIE